MKDIINGFYEYNVKFYIDDVDYDSFIDFEYSVKEVE